MDKESNPSDPTPKCDPAAHRACLLDPRQQDKLVGQVKKLTGEDGLLRQVIEQAKASNELARKNNKQLRVVIGLLALYGAVLVVVAASGVHIVNDFVDLERRLDGTVTQMDDLATQMRDTEKKVDSVKKDTDTIREDRETQPRVELVEEQDPAKAKDAPIKVRIMPPSVKRAPKPHDSAGIDVPLTKDTVIKDADPLDGETDEHTEP